MVIQQFLTLVAQLHYALALHPRLKTATGRAGQYWQTQAKRTHCAAGNVVLFMNQVNPTTSESAWGYLAFSMSPQECLSFPCPFGSIRITSLDLDLSARSTGCPSENQLCTACHKKKEKKKKVKNTGQGWNKKMAYLY